MKIILTKKTSLALAASLTMIVGTVNAVENMEQTNAVSGASVSSTSEDELTPFEEFLIILGLKEEKETKNNTSLQGKIDCKERTCGTGVKH